MALKNIREAATRASAMSAGGMDAGKIVDRLLESRTTPEVNARIKQARQQGISDEKLVSDLTQKARQIQPTATDQDIGGPLGAISDFVGTKQLGTRIGSELGSAGLDKDTKRRLIEAEQKGFADPGTVERVRTGGVSDVQALGSAATTGLNILGASSLGGQLMSPTGANLGRKMLGYGLAGGAEGATRAIAEDDEDVGGRALTGAAFGAAIPVASATLQYLSNRVPKLLGIVIGESEDTVQKGMLNPDAFDAGLEQGDTAIQKGIKEIREGATETKKAFNKGYKEIMGGIFKVSDLEDAKVNKKSVINSFKNFLEDTGVKIDGDDLDFSMTGMKPSGGEKSAIKKTFNQIKNWDDWSIKGTNKLKQNIGQLTDFPEGFKTAKSPTLKRLYGQLNEEITNNIPKGTTRDVYQRVNERYSQKIPIFRGLEKVKNYSQLNTFLKNEADNIKDLVETPVLKDMLQEVRAAEAGKTTARAVKSKGGTFGAYNPNTWIDFLFSPEIQGKAISNLGRFQQGAQRTLSTQIPSNLGTIGSQLGAVGRTLSTKGGMMD